MASKSWRKIFDNNPEGFLQWLIWDCLGRTGYHEMKLCLYDALEVIWCKDDWYKMNLGTKIHLFLFAICCRNVKGFTDKDLNFFVHNTVQ